VQSLSDDIILALEDHAATFSIPNLTVRDPYDETKKDYPYVVVHEIVNVPQNHGTVNGETRTILAYQLDIYTTNCVDTDSLVLTAYKAGRRLVGEIDAVLDGELKLTRRTIHHERIGADVIRHIVRGECVLESSGYTYRL